MKNIALRNFSRFWIAGLLLLIFMISSNFLLITDVSPFGMGSHQSARNADNINAIQHAWSISGALYYAKGLMIVDLFFIAIYGFGALCGGILLCYDEKTFIRRIGGVVIAASVIFILTDYAETICQIIQLFQMQGADDLAYAAAAVGSSKNIAFIVTFLGLLGSIIFNKMRG